MDSTEISGKIRAAIKAKLEELGAYADEELPDYIMVMVANKKSRAQMTEDLNLFLGKNAATFTKWLHEVLDRLSNLSKGSGGAAASDDSPAKEEKKEKKRKKEKEEKEDESKAHKRAKDKKEKRHSKEETSAAEQPSSKRPRSKDENAAPKASPPRPHKDESSRKAMPSRIRSPSPPPVHSDPNAAFPSLPSRYDYVDKQSTTYGSKAWKAASSKHRRISPPRSPVQGSPERGSRSSRGSRSPLAAGRYDLDADLERYRRERDGRGGSPSAGDMPPRPPPRHPRSRSPRRRRRTPPRRTGRHAPITAPRRSHSPATPPPPQRTRSRGDRRGRRDSPEEYDPLNPAMASTVYVPPRPRASGESSRRDGQVFARAVREMQRVVPNRKRSRGGVAEEEADDWEEEKEVEVRGPAVRRPRHASPHRTTIKDRLGGRGPLRSVGAVENLVIGLSADRRRVEMEDASDEEENVVTITEPLPPGDEEAPLAKSSSSEEQATKEAGSKGLPPDDAVEIFLAPLKEAKEGGPRFTVTMEGVQDDFRARLEQKVGMSSSLESSVSVESRDGRSGPTPLAAKAPFALPDTSVPPPPLPFVPTQAATPAVFPNPGLPPAPKAVRCKFFPACANADCPYIHPTKQCTAFPACRFGAACLYIHPPCKFGAACTRPDCAFTHGGTVAKAPVAKPPPKTSLNKKVAVPATLGAVRKAKAGGVEECRFGSNCRKAGCSFAHSPQCKYGALCTRSDCVFAHPPGRGTSATAMPPKSGRVTAKASAIAAKAAYKWIKPKDGAEPAIEAAS